MKLITQKLGKQYNSSDYFKYRVRAQAGGDNYIARLRDDYKEFNQVREWCWVTWGPSSEELMYGIAENLNPQWAWRVDPITHRTYIYLAGDEELALLKLSWL